MKYAALLMTVALTGCVSTRQPAMTYQSTHARAQVKECLLNRMVDNNIRVRVHETPEATEIILDASIIHTPTMNFVIRDAPNGSTIEYRRLSRLTPGRGNAETCF